MKMLMKRKKKKVGLTSPIVSHSAVLYPLFLLFLKCAGILYSGAHRALAGSTPLTACLFRKNLMLNSIISTPRPLE